MPAASPVPSFRFLPARLPITSPFGLGSFLHPCAGRCPRLGTAEPEPENGSLGDRTPGLRGHTHRLTSGGEAKVPQQRPHPRKTADGLWVARRGWPAVGAGGRCRYREQHEQLRNDLRACMSTAHIWVDGEGHKGTWRPRIQGPLVLSQEAELDLERALGSREGFSRGEGAPLMCAVERWSQRGSSEAGG